MQEPSIILPDVIELNNSTEWNSVIAADQDASVYHLWEWGEALSRTYGYKRHFLASMEGNRILGVFPLVNIKSLLFGNRLISLPFCEYGGIATRSELRPEEARHAVDSLLSASFGLAKNIGAEYIAIREPLIQSDAFQADGYEKSKEYVTFKIDLTKKAVKLWSDLKKQTRNAVRKSVKSGLELETAKESAELKTYYELYLKTQKRLGSPPHCFELFKNLFETFSQSGKIRVLLAKNKGRPAAGIIILLHRDTIFWWNNVSDVRYRSLNPTNFLLWNAIEQGAKDGYKLMDLGRTRRGTTVYDFKGGWGGQELILHDYIRFVDSDKKELPDPSQGKYRYLSRAWSLLPISVAKRLGPRVISGIGL